MATYRCASCEGIYVSPQAGMDYHHACPPIVDDPVTGRTHRRPDHRDENVVQEFEIRDGLTVLPAGGGRVGKVRMQHAGKGRVKLADDDLLTGADADQLARLRAMPGVHEPDL